MAIVADNVRRPAAAGYRRVAAWLFAALFLLAFLFLLQAQFARWSSLTPDLVSSDDGTFASYDEFIERQERDGFRFLGRFADRWPATVVEEATAQDEISFKLNGRQHNYSEFEGYRLKVVRLKTDDGAESVVVLRSVGKR